jgi:TonB family protein
MRAATLLAIATVLAAATPAAQAKERESDFWGGVVDPGRKQFEAAMARGDNLLKRAKNMPDASLKTKMLEDALAAFDEATKYSPRNFRGWYRRGKVLMALDRIKAGVKSLKRARRLGASGPEVQFDIAFDLGIAYSKAGKFEKAVLEYDRADRAKAGARAKGFSVRGDRSTVHGNAAEALMALGRLDEAIQRYRESLSYVPSNTLVRYGLAVAYDRDEQISKAHQAMRKALATDPDMRKLTSPNVFFIPEGDIHSYFALGYLVKGDLEKAKEEWQLFLQKLPRSQWAPRARAHLAALGVTSRKRPEGRKKRLAPPPKPIQGHREAGARDRAAIRSRIYNYTYRLRSCYRSALRKKSDLAGELRVAFTVNAKGRAERIRVVRSNLRRPTLHKCVIEVIKRIYFSRPISGRPVRMEFPVKFKP